MVPIRQKKQQNGSKGAITTPRLSGETLNERIAVRAALPR